MLGSALISFIILALFASVHEYFALDLRLARAIQSIRWPGFRSLMIAVSALGNDWTPVVLVLLTGVGLFLLRLKTEGILCVAGVGLGDLINRLTKFVIGRPRPSRDLLEVFGQHEDPAFPSGHVAVYVEFFGFLFFLTYVLLRPGRLRQALLLIFGTLVVLVGISRVYLGAHWPSDVAGAYLAGGIWLFIMIDLYRRRKKGVWHPW